MAKRLKKEALLLSYDLWLWLAKNPDKNKGDWPEWKQYKDADKCNYCFACEYNTYHPTNWYCGDNCIIPILSLVCCEDEKSIYTIWRDNKQNEVIRSAAAYMIAISCKNAAETQT